MPNDVLFLFQEVFELLTSNKLFTPQMDAWKVLFSRKLNDIKMDFKNES